MGKSKKVIIFCHYGDSDYLKYTLRQCKLTNPENRIVLLGDEKNRIITERTGTEHYLFEDYNDSVEIQRFEKVYQHVAGKKHGREYWTKFVFKRWFYIHEFIKREKINAFWHFDSDNMILSDLNQQEYKFQNFDCTEQCNGICMNGYISSFAVVDGYVKKINELFENQRYLDEQKEDFIKHPNYAFTEMRAYKAYKEQEEINSIRLNKIIDNETFDDCICQKHGYDTYEFTINGQYLKKIYLDANGHFYCYHINFSAFIKMNSLNLSWVPTNLFKLILETSINGHSDKFRVDKFLLLDISFLAKVSRIKSIIKRLIPNSAKQYIKAVMKRILSKV